MLIRGALGHQSLYFTVIHEEPWAISSKRFENISFVRLKELLEKSMIFWQTVGYKSQIELLFDLEKFEPLCERFEL